MLDVSGLDLIKLILDFFSILLKLDLLQGGCYLLPKLCADHSQKSENVKCQYSTKYFLLIKYIYLCKPPTYFPDSQNKTSEVTRIPAVDSDGPVWWSSIYQLIHNIHNGSYAYLLDKDIHRSQTSNQT